MRMKPLVSPATVAIATLALLVVAVSFIGTAAQRNPCEALRQDPNVHAWLQQGLIRLDVIATGTGSRLWPRLECNIVNLHVDP